MSGWKAEDDGPCHIGRETLDDVADCDHRTVALVASAHFTEDDSPGAGHDAAEPQLGQHPVNAVRALVHVLDEQNAPVRREDEPSPTLGQREKRVLIVSRCTTRQPPLETAALE